MNIFLSTRPPVSESLSGDQLFCTRTALLDLAWIATDNFTIVHEYQPEITEMLAAVAEGMNRDKKGSGLKIVTVAKQEDKEHLRVENLIVMDTNDEHLLRRTILHLEPHTEQGKQLAAMVDEEDYSAAVFIGGDTRNIEDFAMFSEAFQTAPVYIVGATGGACLELKDRVQPQPAEIQKALDTDISFIEVFDRIFPNTAKYAALLKK